ncbi:MAG: glycohydrolase toxin TNT-related protein [Janthinobacterium lividum]
MSYLDELWNEAVGDTKGALDWLKQVILGEFDDHQSTSAMITQLLVSFVPGAVIVMSARDLTAVLIRMVRHPDKRENITEWMILVACAIGLVPALIGAAAGAAAAGVGAIVGGLAGDEAGAALRATALLLIEDGARMLEKVVQFLRRFIKGDIMRFLREVKFVKYAEPVAEEVGKFIGHLISVTQKVIARASHYTWFSRVGDIIEKLRTLERGFYALQSAAAHKIPQVMAEFDSRLQRALGEHMAQADHVVHPNTPAPHPTPKPPTPKRVAARADHPLGKPSGLEPADPLPPKTPPDKNLHPQGVEEEPRASAQDTRAANVAATKQKIKLRSDLDDKYFEDNGRLKWPDDNGALNGWQDKPLQPGQVIDRYGDPSGKFTSPMQVDANGNVVSGESYEARSLPYDQSKIDYHQYRVIKEIPNQQSVAAPYFDQQGMAVQNYHAPIDTLIPEYLEEITPK